jgi:glycosyltransferase involved in cell wall biosynthesis
MSDSGSPAPIYVALLRGLAGRLGPSVLEFVDALELGFSRRTDIEMQGEGLRPLGLAGAVGSSGLLAGAEDALDGMVRYPLSLRRNWRSKEFDVFHIADQWYAHLAAWLPRERTVVSCQDLILAKYPELPTEHRPTRRDRIRFAFSLRQLSRVSHVVCSTHAVRRDIIRLAGVAPERISVVAKGVGPHMTPLADHREALRRTLPPAEFIVLSVSTGWPYKNVAATVEVLARLRQRGLDAMLVRVGVPLDGAELRLAERLGVGAHVRELGRIGDQRLVEVFNAADVLLFPSLDEGFGRPPVEAMACGTPVVISSAPALAEVVDDAGLQAPARDIAGLTAAVEAVLLRPALAAELRERGLRRARRFTWAATVEGYAAVYEQLAARGSPGHP